MAYVALYRQWRPQDFDALVGQQPVKTALSNALDSGRIAHAYLFAGPRGTGKTSTARILAKALNCEQGPTPHPCGHCDNCERIAAGASMDVFEIDAASNRGIDEIKTLREQLAFTPVDSRYKVYIIDEVHMLTTEAFNALLKTLEEPPAHVIFILATTDPHKIPATIHSRCQRFDFRRVTVEEIAAHLAMVAEGSGITADAEALRLIAIQSEGGMRDALSLLDQCGVMDSHVSVQTIREVLGIVGREALRELVDAIGRQDFSTALGKLNQLLEQGKDVRQVLAELAEYLRALLLYQAAPDFAEIYLTDAKEALAERAALFGRERLLAAEERLHSAVLELRGALRPRITAELCLLDLCRIEGSTIAALAARVEQLERQLAAGVALRPAPTVESAPQLTAEAVAAAAPEPQLYAQAVPPPRVEPKSEPPAKPAAAVKPTPTASPQPAPVQQPAVKPAPQPKPQAQATEEYAGDFAAGEDYWAQALALLKAEKKNSMVSCAKNGRVYSFANNILQVAFKNQFFCDRMNQSDYRLPFEDALLRVARSSIRLEAVLEGSAKKAPAPKPAAVQPQEQQDSVAQEQLPDNLRRAAEVFGGTVTEIPNILK